MHILYKRFATKLIIDKHGDCWWNVPTTLLSQCSISVASFPFDTQECSATIGSWTYSRNKFNITYFLPNADLSHFIENGEWLVKSALLHNRLKHYDYYGKEELPYSDVTLTLKIQRLTKYYWVNIIVPSIVIWMLSLLSFVLPSDNGERVTLVISALLALSVYMLIASSFLPETSEAVPILGIYYLLVFIETALCLCATCWTIKLRNKMSPMEETFEDSWIITKLPNCLRRFRQCKVGEGTLQGDLESNASGHASTTEDTGSQSKVGSGQASSTEDTGSQSKVGSGHESTTEDTASQSKVGSGHESTTEDTGSQTKVGSSHASTTEDIGSQTKVGSGQASTTEDTGSQTKVVSGQASTTEDTGSQTKVGSGQASSTGDTGSQNMVQALREELRSLIGELRSKNEEEEEFAKKGKREAKELDRLFLGCFSVVYVVSILVLFGGYMIYNAKMGYS